MTFAIDLSATLELDTIRTLILHCVFDSICSSERGNDHDGY